MSLCNMSLLHNKTEIKFLMQKPKQVHIHNNKSHSVKREQKGEKLRKKIYPIGPNMANQPVGVKFVLIVSYLGGCL